MTVISTDDPLAVAAVAAIRTGDVAALADLLARHPQLATARLGDADGGDDVVSDDVAGDVAGDRDRVTRTLLHVVTDWPGHVPNGAEMVAVLVEAGADVNARFSGPHTETPLHWAASSDDVEVLDALLDAGADIEAPGAVIAGGTPLADATAFGQWRAARRLLERGARTTMWEAAALGLLDRIVAFYEADRPPSQDDTTRAFWGACHGGHREVAEYLLDQGADINWPGWDGLTPLGAAERGNAGEVAAWLRSRGAA